MSELPLGAHQCIWCVACDVEVPARLTTGAEIFQEGIPRLNDHHFWRCDSCGNYVSCPSGSATPNGVIATPEIRREFNIIHQLMDGARCGGTRAEVYAELANLLGVEAFHAGEIRTMTEARRAHAMALLLWYRRRKPKQRDINKLARAGVLK